jgi:hypothetical protein
MDHKATGELLYALLNSINKEFKANLNPHIMIANSWVTDPGQDVVLPEEPPAEKIKSKKKIVIAGASNMRRLVPSLKMAGFEVIDLTQPSWLATCENVELLTEKLTSLNLDTDSVVILELFGNSTYRYRQFDGTMALPFKAGHGYHMEGEVGVCDDCTFAKLCCAVQPIIDSCGSAIKIIVPPLPRYLYTGCCANKFHCTNVSNEDYELRMLQATMHFRPLIKDALLSTGTDRFFVLDGIGALLGIPAGNNRGAATEILKELSNYCAQDGVHFNERGYVNLAKVISSAISGVQSGLLTRSDPGTGSISGRKKTTFFWRGFTSPVGYTGPRNAPVSQPFPMSIPGPSQRPPAPAPVAALQNFPRGGGPGPVGSGRHSRFPRSSLRGRNVPYWKKI